MLVYKSEKDILQSTDTFVKEIWWKQKNELVSYFDCFFFMHYLLSFLESMYKFFLFYFFSKHRIDFD